MTKTIRSITLLNEPGKVFYMVIKKRLAETAEERLRESQCDFCKGCGCVYQIFMLRILADKLKQGN